jgi:hypothetical protein
VELLVPASAATQPRRTHNRKMLQVSAPLLISRRGGGADSADISGLVYLACSITVLEQRGFYWQEQPLQHCRKL